MSAQFRVGVASRPIRTEVISGDQIAVVVRDAVVTIAVVDGLGHGPEAAYAALRVTDLVRENAALGLGDIVRLSHEKLRGTRGAALALLRLGPGLASAHAAVGNVEVAALTRGRFRAMAVPGVVGTRVRKVVVTEQVVAPGDLLCVHTDGISSRLSLEPYRDVEPAAAAIAILERYGKEQDDAACVLVRC